MYLTCCRDFFQSKIVFGKCYLVMLSHIILCFVLRIFTKFSLRLHSHQESPGCGTIFHVFKFPRLTSLSSDKTSTQIDTSFSNTNVPYAACVGSYLYYYVFCDSVLLPSVQRMPSVFLVWDRILDRLLNSYYLPSYWT